MDNAFVRLLKVLHLERKQGFRNKAVIGGLDKFVSRWEADARSEAPNSPVVGEIVTLLLMPKHHSLMNRSMPNVRLLKRRRPWRRSCVCAKRVAESR